MKKNTKLAKNLQSKLGSINPIGGFSITNACRGLAIIDLILDVTLLIYVIVVVSTSSSTVYGILLTTNELQPHAGTKHFYFAIVLFPSAFVGAVLNLTLAATVNERSHLVPDLWLVVAGVKSSINLLAAIVNLSVTKSYIALSVITIAPIPFRIYMIWVVYIFKKNLMFELKPTKLDPSEIRVYNIPEIKIQNVADERDPSPPSRRKSTSSEIEV